LGFCWCRGNGGAIVRASGRGDESSTLREGHAFATVDIQRALCTGRIYLLLQRELVLDKFDTTRHALEDERARPTLARLLCQEAQQRALERNAPCSLVDDACGERIFIEESVEGRTAKREGLDVTVEEIARCERASGDHVWACTEYTVGRDAALAALAAR
jgi:hypothetical protein